MKLFVGNLPFETTDAQLLALFEPYGQVVSAKIIHDRETQRPKGFGFVEMKNVEDAEAAMKELNGQPYGEKQRELRIQEAQDRPRTGGGYQGGGQGGRREYRQDGGRDRGDRRGRW